MKKNLYKIDNNVERLLIGKPSDFLDNTEFKKVMSKLKNINCKIYNLYEDQEKVILYTKQEPKVSLSLIHI